MPSHLLSDPPHGVTIDATDGLVDAQSSLLFVRVRSSWSEGSANSESSLDGAYREVARLPCGKVTEGWSRGPPTAGGRC